MLPGEEQTAMALLKLKRAAQITIPAELRKQFNLEEGDYLEAEAVKDLSEASTGTRSGDLSGGGEEIPSFEPEPLLEVDGVSPLADPDFPLDL